ncbi:hypothetical protein BGZ89_008660 [Linnemannia elongata]|nr:hypothetical protein BGZ89_008660 [Linnemannia elongata]
MDGIFPVCYTTNGGYIYTAAYDTRHNRAQARLIVAQSKYYPTSLNNLTWDAIGEVPQDFMRASMINDYTYNCAWNNDTATFALLGQTLETPWMKNTTSRFGIEFSTAFSGPKPGTRNYRLLAHSNSKLYMVGSSVADGTLLVTTLPLNPKTLGTKPLTIAQPDRYMAPTFESDLGKDCDLDHHWSTASAYNSQLFVLCYPKIEAEKNTELQLFLFNGTIFQKIASITTPFLTLNSPKNHGPSIVPIPFNPTTDTKASTWFYLSVNFGRGGYLIDLTGVTTGGGIGGTIIIDGRSISQPFVLDSENSYLPNDVYKDGTSNVGRPQIPIAAWIGGFFGLLLLILFAVWMVHRHRVRAKEARRREMIANGMDPDMNPETAGGVTRTQYGDDASDALPLYTLRAPSVPFMVQQPTDHSAPTITAVGAAIATATGAATASAGAAVAATPIPVMPEPSELPPGYSPDPSRPGNGQQEDTRSVCIDSETNSVNTPAADTAALTTDASTAQEATDVPAVVENETIATTPPHPSTTATGDNKTNL